jgi:Ca2+-binding EF-hand superfamily protein
LGKLISDEELSHIMKKHDLTNDGCISFEEFKEMMMECDEDDMVVEDD